MADPFKKAVGRVMRTDLKSDEAGPYYDVQVSGGGGVAPVSRGQDASPTVLDPERDYGPPLPPGSVGYGDEEGPDEEDFGVAEDDEPEEPGFDPNADTTAVNADYQKRLALYRAYPDNGRSDPNAPIAQSWIDDFARRRLEVVGLDPATASSTEMAAALGIAPAMAETVRQRFIQGGFGGEE